MRDLVTNVFNEGAIISFPKNDYFLLKKMKPPTLYDNTQT